MFAVYLKGYHVCVIVHPKLVFQIYANSFVFHLAVHFHATLKFHVLLDFVDGFVVLMAIFIVACAVRL